MHMHITELKLFMSFVQESFGSPPQYQCYQKKLNPFLTNKDSNLSP
jgi:hypothetical protein